MSVFGIQFYPTPADLVDKMYDKVKWDKVTYILEPSAGKGDLLNGFKRYEERNCHKYYKFRMFKNKENVNHRFLATEKDMLEYMSNFFNKSLTSYDEVLDCADDYENTHDNVKIFIDVETENKKLPKFEIECVEIDKSLCEILSQKRYFVNNCDFLEFTKMARYDLILMNPPFKDGDKHLLKALQMIENGGQCVCILNAETIRNPYSDSRQYLCNLLEKYSADIEFISEAFSDGEVKTDVEIALIYVNIPTKTIEFNVMKDMVLGEDYSKDYKKFNETQVATDDIIGNLVKQYEFEAKLGIKLIDYYYSMEQYIPTCDKDSKNRLIALSVRGVSEDAGVVKHPINTYIAALRDKYWTLLFNSNEFSKLLTESMKTKYLSEIRNFRNYDFTFSNIKQLQINLSNSMSQNLDEAILKQWDDLTYKYSMDNSSNVHYFNGWKTNRAFMLSKKCIKAMWGIYDHYGWSLYKAQDFLVELEKIFTYLDSGRTDGDDANKILYEHSHKTRYNGEKIHFKYFDVEFKKKGTIHIWFTNEELLKKFNIFGCQKHGWLPDCYGKKTYEKMTKEEQEVIDSFEGKKSYENTMIESQFYLGGGNILQLTVDE